MPEGVAQVDGVALGCEGACVDDGLGVARDGFGLGLKLEPRPIYIDECLMPIPLIKVAHAHFKLAHQVAQFLNNPFKKKTKQNL